MPTSPSRRRRAEQHGRNAEAAVIAAWQQQGFSILAQRERTPSGEIDIVAADAQTLVFVEVKARKTLSEAAHAIRPRQQTRLLQAAESLLATHETWARPTTRFDVALVCNGTITHLQDAIRYQ